MLIEAGCFRLPGAPEISVQLSASSASLITMRALRLVLAGLVAFAAVVAVLLTAAVVLVTGLAAYVVQLFRKPTSLAQSAPRTGTDRRSTVQTDDVIDIVSTKLPGEPTKD